MQQSPQPPAPKTPQCQSTTLPNLINLIQKIKQNCPYQPTPSPEQIPYNTLLAQSLTLISLFESHLQAREQEYVTLGDQYDRLRQHDADVMQELKQYQDSLRDLQAKMEGVWVVVAGKEGEIGELVGLLDERDARIGQLEQENIQYAKRIQYLQLSIHKLQQSLQQSTLSSYHQTQKSQQQHQTTLQQLQQYTQNYIKQNQILSNRVEQLMRYIQQQEERMERFGREMEKRGTGSSYGWGRYGSWGRELGSGDGVGGEARGFGDGVERNGEADGEREGDGDCGDCISPRILHNIKMHGYADLSPQINLNPSNYTQVSSPNRQSQNLLPKGTPSPTPNPPKSSKSQPKSQSKPKPKPKSKPRYLPTQNSNSSEQPNQGMILRQILNTADRKSINFGEMDLRGGANRDRERSVVTNQSWVYQCDGDVGRVNMYGGYNGIIKQFNDCENQASYANLLNLNNPYHQSQPHRQPPKPQPPTFRSPNPPTHPSPAPNPPTQNPYYIFFLLLTQCIKINSGRLEKVADIDLSKCWDLFTEKKVPLHEWQGMLERKMFMIEREGMGGGREL